MQRNTKIIVATFIMGVGVGAALPFQLAREISLTDPVQVSDTYEMTEIDPNLAPWGETQVVSTQWIPEPYGVGDQGEEVAFAPFANDTELHDIQRIANRYSRLPSEPVDQTLVDTPVGSEQQDPQQSARSYDPMFDTARRP